MITLTAAGCAWCGHRLPADGPSPDFCNETHQYFWQEAHRRSAPTYAEMRAKADAAVRAVAAAAAVLRPAFEAIGQAATAIVESWRRAGLLEPPPPVDPKQRALELRRARNTGPTISRRPPIRIGPTRTRR